MVSRHIVGRVELLAIETVAQNRPGTIVFAAAHPAGIVLTRDQPALVVAAVAVRIAGFGLIHADMAVILAPAQHAMVRDVAPQQAAPVTHPHRAFAPESLVVPHAVPDALQRGVALPSTEALVLHFEGRFGVSNWFFAGPIPVPAKLVRPGKRRACAGDNGR